MEKAISQSIFTILSHLMDETIDHNNNLEILNDIQLTVDEKLIPSIEKVQYENKYELIDRIRDICRDISLYLYFPEMINCVLVGFHSPDTYAFCNCMISDDVPSIIYGSTEEQEIKGLNLADKVVTISDKEYSELLIHSKSKEIDLAGVLYNILIPSKEMNAGQIYLIIPKGVDSSKKYYLSLTSAVDILVICAEECSEKVLKEYKNISQVFVYGRMTSENKKWFVKYCEENEISVKYFNSLSPILENLKKDKQTNKRNNFCYVYYLENILYEISWYLSTIESEAERPLIDINDNLLFKNEKSYQCVKDLQKKYNEKIKFITKLYAEYQSICKDLVGKMELLQNNYGVKESIYCLNQHIDMKEVLLELILKLSETYKVFPETDSKEKMRKYCDIYKKVSGNTQVSNIILNDFLGESLPQNDLEAFNCMHAESPFFKRKKIDLCDKLNLPLDECASIVLGLNGSLRNEEKRILGEYYLRQNNGELAKKYLKEALGKGNQKAGEMLVNKMSISQAELKQIADYGVKCAAYKLGKDLYSRGDILQCIKYLNIAASQKDLNAIKLLGNISYEKYIENSDVQEAAKALHYYMIAEKQGTVDLAIYGKMGEIYFIQKNYLKSREYCKKADTSECNYILGLIAENGYGCAVNKNCALGYYLKAKRKGHLEAEVAYERLNAEIEERRMQKVIDENKSYSSSSYTSNYSSSSGW